jgi:hypothetical protein
VGVTISAAWLRAGARVVVADIGKRRVVTTGLGEAIHSDEPFID